VQLPDGGASWSDVARVFADMDRRGMLTPAGREWLEKAGRRADAERE
jgi:hypothetical protein